jgi:histidinol-phosphate aminotransferase
VTERERVAAALRSTGYEIPLSQANFVWLPIGDEAVRFAEHCSADNVLVRPFAGEGVRVTIGLPEENDRFLTLAESWTPTSRRS